MLMATMPLAAQQVEDEAQGDSLELNTESSYGDTGTSKRPGKKKSPNGFWDTVSDFFQKDHNYHAYTFTYQSIDANKNPITLSAKAYLDSYWGDVDHIILSCHPTVTSNSEVPTGANPVDGDIRRMCGETGSGYMVVCPDYCGYGVSSYAQHPYLIHDVTARNCVDAVVEAVRILKEKKEWHCWGLIYDDYELKDGYDTQIVGYSQGGATALACAKYLESAACPKEIKDKVKYSRTTCGDGPYSIRATLDQYIKWGQAEKDLEYPCVLPLIISAAKEAYKDGCMKTVEVKDFFNNDFLEKTGILAMLSSKVTTTSDINARIKAKWDGGLRPADILSRAIVNSNGTYNTSTLEYKCLQRAMDLAELASGWVPQHTITFFHLENDGVVPYNNYIAVQNGIGKNNPNVKYLTEKELQENNKWTDRTYFAFLSWYKNVPRDESQKLDHASGGLYFYIAYMFYLHH